MTFCLVILAVCMFFGYFSQKHSEKLALAQGKSWAPDQNGAYARLECWSIALILILVFVCGLRIRYNDTSVYIQGFLQSPTLAELLKQPLYPGDCPGFLCLQAAVRSVTDNQHLFIMLCAAFCIAPLLIFLKRYSANFFLSVFLFVTTEQLLFSLAAIKQAMAIAIAIWAIPLFLKKKYLQAFLVLLAAALFHPYVLLFLILPFLAGKPWGIKMLCVMAAVGGVALFFDAAMRMILDLAGSLGDAYTSEAFSGAGVNVLRVLVFAMTPLLSLIFLDRVRQGENQYQHTFINIATLCFGIMFLALFGTANLIGRVALYFSFSLALSLPYIFSRLEKKSCLALSGIAMIMYFAYYLYGIRNITYQMISLEAFFVKLLS
ncbi:MAG: EpsG family protein [Clostridia bacterium]|nr:EpsG family protein [Clostridia bacterium]